MRVIPLHLFDSMKTKTISAILVALYVSAHWTNAQSTALTATPAPQSKTGGGMSPPPAVPYAVVERGANHRVWQKTTYETTPSGKTVSRVHQYTELATGLHYQKNGQWVESKEQIDILPNGSAVAAQGQHQAYFPGDIYQGVIELVTPDGKHLKSRPLGLSYDDGSNTVLVAELKNSAGYLVGSNQVIYPDAFVGVKADLRYTYTKAGFEQDVILRSQPPAPEDFNLNPQTARLQVLTEFFGPPRPAVRTATLRTGAGNLTDQQLSFGVMQMTPGKAFLLGTNSPSVQVGKQWLMLDGRQLLVEEVPVNAVADKLSQLPPPPAASTRISPGSPLHMVSAKRLLPAQPLAQVDSGKRLTQMVQAAVPAQGLVLDYITLNSSLTNYTFQGDTTYFISGPVILAGTVNFEGGAVLKYSWNASLDISLVTAVNCQATAYRPVVFTAKDDDSVGQIIDGSFGSPSGWYANPALYYNNPPQWVDLNLSHFRIANARQAIWGTSCGLNINLNDGQIVNTLSGISTPGQANIQLNNVLFADFFHAFDLYMAYVSARHVTFVGLSSWPTYLVAPSSGSPPYNYSISVSLDNCILANIQTFSTDGTIPIYADHNGFYNNGNAPIGTSTFVANSNPFLTVGAGNYYLADDTFRGKGATSIPASLASDLASKTTYPPTVWTNAMLATNAVWSRQVPRDDFIASGGAPDLGYHYDPLDYLTIVPNGSSVMISNRISLTLSNGVAAALSGYTGFRLNIGWYGVAASYFSSVGTATRMNHLVWYPAVQEQSVKINNQAVNSSKVFDFDGVGTNKPAVQLTFTDVAMQGLRQRLANSYFSAALTNCWLRGVELVDGPTYVSGLLPWVPVITLKNNLVERSTVQIYDGCYWLNTQGGWVPFWDPIAVNLYNNLFWQSELDASYMDAACFWWPYHPQWNINDNLFDNATVTFSGDGNYASYIAKSNNAYINTTMPSQLIGTGDVSLTVLSYATGPLGPWYIGSSTPTLINVGSRTADQVGLYHYTVMTNQVKETNSVVDIGYHYVAVDQYGNPIDSNEDGIPDYLEDANGNGLVDSGETPWLPPPTITVQPQDQTAYQSSNATFSVTATSMLPMIYQWTFNGTNILDATNSSLFLADIQYSQAGEYAVVVTNVGGSVTSSNAVLTVVGNTVITQQPLSQFVFDCDTVTFAVEISGNTNVSYQWTTNDVAIGGATNSSYTINYVQDSDAGNYAVIISDGSWSLTSSNATLQTYFDGELDYSDPPYLIYLLGPRQDYVFKSGVTYLVPFPVVLYGKTTFEAGTVIKPDWATDGTLEIAGTLTCKGRPYYPSIITSVDDDSVGYPLFFSYTYGDGPPQPYENGLVYLYLDNAQNNSINNLRICYADYGVTTPTASQKLDVWDCQFLQCNNGVVDQVVGASATNSLHNVLFSACGVAVTAVTNSVPVIEAEQVTADVGDFFLAPVTPSRIALTNCIIKGNPVTASDLSTINVAFNPDPTNFQSAGAGDYYLAANSPLHAAGTANISSRLKNEYQRKTTYAPMTIAAGLQTSGQLALSPQAGRYTNGAPDLGYYYDALDYTIADMILLQGGSLTVLPGTAIGFRREPSAARGTLTSWGVDLREGSSFTSHGTPNQPITFCDIQFVQEQMANPCVVFFTPDFKSANPNDPAPLLDFRFCNFYLTGGWSYGFWGYFQWGYLLWSGYDEWGWYEESPDSVMNWNMQDCAVHGGKIQMGAPQNPNYFYGTGEVTWKNNLFDQVNIYLQPTYYYSYYQFLNCDLQVQAYNNLFRGGLWFLLAPNPSSAGNWIFKDNLFEGLNFYQDAEAPLELNNNAYWPVTTHDLAMLDWEAWWWYGADSAELTPTISGDGTHEVTLTTAPPYQSGPFGNYYLPNTTPLYGAGSTNAGALGLAQYTTSTNQTKEGATHTVNIGLHYVAANNNGQPLDSDGDGIPDYVEDANGNGSVDANETSPSMAMTDGFTPDAYNSVYDDVDLDGDGLTGTAERFFGTNPTNSDNPLSLLAVPQQSTLSGIVQIPLNIGTNVDTNTTFTLLVNGIAQNTIVYQTNGNWFAVWDSTAVANGNYQLSVEYDFDEDTPVFGATKFVNAQNAVCFPNSLPMCGGSLYIQPQTINTNGSYTMEIYDDQTNLFASLDGDVDGNGFCLAPNTGQPGITVSLLDTNNNQWPSASYTVQVTTYPASVLAQSKNSFQPNQSGGGGASGTHRVPYSHPMTGHKWVIAFMPVYGDIIFGSDSAQRLGSLMQAAVYAVIGSAYGPNNSVNGQYQTSGGEVGLMLNDPGNPSPYDPNKWNQLGGLLNDPEAHNFFYFGHGAPDFIGMQSRQRITSAELESSLTNHLDPSRPFYAYQWGHRYRFVFLDGCDTAKGILPLAFGMPNNPPNVSQDEFDNNYHVQPFAFLGWNSSTANSVKNKLPGLHAQFILNFWNKWSGINDEGDPTGDAPQNLRQALDNTGSPSLSGSITLFGCPTLPFYQ